jgi:hypothetical protein
MAHTAVRARVKRGGRRPAPGEREAELVARVTEPDHYQVEGDAPRTEADAAAHGLSVVGQAGRERERLPAAILPGCQRHLMLDGGGCVRPARGCTYTGSGGRGDYRPCRS